MKKMPIRPPLDYALMFESGKDFSIHFKACLFEIYLCQTPQPPTQLLPMPSELLLMVFWSGED